MQIWNDTKQAVNPIALAKLSQPQRQPSRLAAYPTVLPSRPTLLTMQLRGCACEANSLGYVDIHTGLTNTGNASILGSVAVGLNFVPGVGTIAAGAVATLTQAVSILKGWLGIGSGRIEADAIVPTQNLLADRLDQITEGFRVGTNPSVSDLQEWYREVWQLGVAFSEFVLLPDFTDRRASGQALNTIMPFIDGTCGYPVPLGMEVPPLGNLQKGCVVWGDGQYGGPGTDGMMGALARAIQDFGGAIPVLPMTIQTAANTGFPVESIPPGPPGPPPGPLPPATAGFADLMPVAVGVLALYVFSQRGKRG